MEEDEEVAGGAAAGLGAAPPMGLSLSRSATDAIGTSGRFNFNGTASSPQMRVAAPFSFGGGQAPSPVASDWSPASVQGGGGLNLSTQGAAGPQFTFGGGGMPPHGFSQPKF